MNDQCGWYSAPCSIQRLSSSFSAAVSFLLLSGGGITVLSRVEKTRRTRALADGLPGTTAKRPDSTRFSASSRTSRRRPALRSRASGPWHLKQLLERTGRTSRLYSTRPPGGAAAAQAGSQQARARAVTVRDGAVYDEGGRGGRLMRVSSRPGGKSGSAGGFGRHRSIFPVYWPA